MVWANPKPIWALMIVTVGCMILVGVSFVLPVFTVENDEGGFDRNQVYYLDHHTFTNESSDFEKDYDYSSTTNPGKDLKAAGEMNRNLRIISLVVILVTTLLLALSSMGKISRAVPGSLFLLSIGSVIATIIHMLWAFPNIILSDLGIGDHTFVGSQGPYTWGMGSAIYLQAVTIGILITCLIILTLYLRKEKKNESSSDILKD